jgi:arginase
LTYKIRYSVIDAPSILGLRPAGVESLPEALKAAGLLEELNAEYAGRLQPSLQYSTERDQNIAIKCRADKIVFATTSCRCQKSS